MLSACSEDFVRRYFFFFLVVFFAFFAFFAFLAMLPSGIAKVSVHCKSSIDVHGLKSTPYFRN